MSEADKQQSSQPDKDEAATERPVPSQAEGDRETVEEDLKQKSGPGLQRSTNPLYKP